MGNKSRLYVEISLLIFLMFLNSNHICKTCKAPFLAGNSLAETKVSVLWAGGLLATLLETSHLQGWNWRPSTPLFWWALSDRRNLSWHARNVSPGSLLRNGGRAGSPTCTWVIAACWHLFRTLQPGQAVRCVTRKMLSSYWAFGHNRNHVMLSITLSINLSRQLCCAVLITLLSECFSWENNFSVVTRRASEFRIDVGGDSVLYYSNRLSWRK